MLESDRLLGILKDLENKRKNGELSAREFYKALLELLADLKDVLVHENIDEKQVRRQIPLLLAFIKSQIGELHARGH